MEVTMVDMSVTSKCWYSGSLKLFEKGKSCNSWTDYWAVLGMKSLRLFTNYESFLNDLEEPKLIRLTADTICQNVRKNNQSFQFKIRNDGTMYSFKCESESAKESWLNTLGKVLSTFCRNSCFHCQKWSEDAFTKVKSNSGNEENSSESSTGSLHSRTDESTFTSTSTNIPRRSIGREDQITKCPLKIYDSEQSVCSSFDESKKERSETEAGPVDVDSLKRSQSSSQVGQAMKNEKSTPTMKNSFGYAFETDFSVDRATSPSVKLFDRDNIKRFSTFLKRSSFKQEHPNTMKEFANPAFVLDDDDFTERPEIPERISRDFDAPLNYDVPSLSKNDPSRSYLKVFTGKNKWKKRRAAVELNVLLLSNPGENSPAQENNVTRIELKPNIKFTLLPRRSNDYRFKMTNGTSEYFFKTSNVQQREFWIKVLTDATSSVCQNTCPRCCTSATRSVPNLTDSDSDLSSEIDVNECVATGDQEADTDDVFYVGMTNPNEGITFINSFSGESERDLTASEEQTVDFPGADQVDNQKPSHLRSGYLKTNAIENNWGQYWTVIAGKQLVLHSSEDNLNELKTIELSNNIQCRTAKRSLYDFRFTLVVSAVEAYEFKCASAHDRREWMTSLERSAGGAAPGLNAGSRISQIMEQIMEKKRVQEMKEKQRKEELKKQQEQLQQKQQQNINGGQDIYDDISPVSNILQQNPEQHNQQQQQQQTIGGGQDIYDDICVDKISQQNLPPIPQQQQPLTPTQERQQKQQKQQKLEQQQAQQEIQQNTENGELYEIIPANKEEQQQQKQQEQEIQQEQQVEQITDEGGKDLYEVIPADSNQQQNQPESQEELYELIPGEKVEQCQQQQNPQQPKKKQKEKKHKKDKEKKIVPELPKKQPKKDKKQRNDKPSPKTEKEQQKLKQENNKKQQKQTTQVPPEKPNEDLTKHKVEVKDVENILNGKLEGQEQQLSWDFEQHVQFLEDVEPEESSSSRESKEGVGLRLEGETGSNVGVIEEKSSGANSPENEIHVTAMSSEIQDVEQFLTQVLGKLSNLPDDVNKERLELSQRLQKLLNLPEKGAGKRKQAPPLPDEPVEENVDENDEGTYGDVAGAPEGEETYDDVVKENTAEVQEEYEDVIGMHQTGNQFNETEELYDDVNTPEVTTTPKDSLSLKSSNNSESLDAKNVAEPRKASDITDKVYEGILDKYKTKGFMKSLTKWQRRFCVLTPLALYYYENQKDLKQKGQIFLPSSGTILRKGCPSFPDVKDGKMCFQLECNDRCYLFKVIKESERDIWVTHIEAALMTDLSDEQSKIMKQGCKMNNQDDDDVDAGAGDEDLYETVDTFQKLPSSSSSDTQPSEEVTNQVSQARKMSGSSNEAPALPSRTKATSDEPPVPEAVEEEEFEEVEDYQLPDVNVPKPGSAGKAGKAKQDEKPAPVVNRQNQSQSGSPTLPPRPTSSSPDAPVLPPRGDKSAPGSQKPPELPSRTTPPTPKKAPELPIRTTPTLKKKNPIIPAEEAEPSPPKAPQEEPEVTSAVKAKPTGEQFDYGKVYVAMWNCQADDEEDLAFSRGNYLYIREKIPNSDWWVASLMDIPDIRVGLVPRNYIMPAYEM